MKNIVRTIFAAMLTLTAFAQKTENRPVTSFDKLQVSGAATVMITKSETASVKVEADESDMKKIITEVRNNKLIVKTKGEIRHNFKVYVAYTVLNAMDVSGASSVKSSNTVNADKLNLTSSGASTIDLQVSIKELKSTANGASTIQLNGTAGNHVAEVDGAASLKAQTLVSASTDVKADGASTARVNASKKIKVVANGASSIFYSGNAEDVEVTSDTASSVKKSS